MSEFSLHQIAPRLARARDQRRAELAVEAERYRRLVGLRLEAERLVAHRELQLVRAYRTRSGLYIRKRQGKLAAAKHALACVERELRERGV